jgi:hypothetical protein
MRDGTGRARVADGPHDAVAEALRAALSGLAHADEVPVLLAADDYCIDVATVLVRRCDDGGRRLRPSDSIRLETSELLRRFAAGSAWHGPAHVLVSRGEAARQARRLGAAMVRSGHAAVVICELRGERAPDPAAPAAQPLGHYRVTTRLLRARGGESGPP